MSPPPNSPIDRAYRDFDLFIRELQEQIDNSGPKRQDQLIDSAYQAVFYRNQLIKDPAKLTQLIEAIDQLRAAAGPGNVVAEEELIGVLSSLMFDCVFSLAPENLKLEAETWNEKEPFPDFVAAWSATFDLLVAFARNTLSFKRPRDSFGGKRRAEAFSMLGLASRILDLSDIFDLAQQTLKGKKFGLDAGGAVEFLEEYFSHRKDEPVSDELETLLKKFASRTNYRAFAITALNTLVITDSISEFEALDRISDWKDKHGYF